MARALLAHDGQDGAGDVYRADEGRRQLPLDLLRRQLLEVTRIEGRALLTSTSMRPKRSTAARTACSASSVLVTSSLTASRSSAWPTASATASRLRPVATNRVAGGQGSLGELQAHAPPSAGDEPDLLVGHSSSKQARTAFAPLVVLLYAAGLTLRGGRSAMSGVLVCGE
jgi:hypothetical protein